MATKIVAVCVLISIALGFYGWQRNLPESPQQTAEQRAETPHVTLDSPVSIASTTEPEPGKTTNTMSAGQHSPLGQSPEPDPLIHEESWLVEPEGAAVNIGETIDVDAILPESGAPRHIGEFVPIDIDG